jgi:hypothetical protein
MIDEEENDEAVFDEIKCIVKPPPNTPRFIFGERFFRLLVCARDYPGLSVKLGVYWLNDVCIGIDGEWCASLFGIQTESLFAELQVFKLEIVFCPPWTDFGNRCPPVHRLAYMKVFRHGLINISLDETIHRFFTQKINHGHVVYPPPPDLAGFAVPPKTRSKSDEVGLSVLHKVYEGCNPDFDLPEYRKLLEDIDGCEKQVYHTLLQLLLVAEFVSKFPQYSLTLGIWWTTSNRAGSDVIMLVFEKLVPVIYTTVTKLSTVHLKRSNLRKLDLDSLTALRQNDRRLDILLRDKDLKYHPFYTAPGLSSRHTAQQIFYFIKQQGVPRRVPRYTQTATIDQ